MPAAIPLAMVGGTIASSIFGAHAATSAANAQVDAANHAADLQSQDANKALDFNKMQYGNALNMGMPYYNMGTASLGKLGFLMGLHPQTGMPPGVVNPNAPPTGATGPNVQNLKGIIDSGGLENFLANRGGGGTFNRFNAAMPQGGMAMMQPNSLPGSPAPGGTAQQGHPGSILQGLLPGEGGHPGGAAGMIQLGPDGKPIGNGTQDVNPLPNGVNLGGPTPNGGTPGDPNPLPNGVNLGGPTPTPATTNQGGTGQVPQTGDPQGLGDGGIQEQLRQQGGLDFSGGNNSGNFGGEGSLSQNFGEQWKAPNAVTEQNDPGWQFRMNQGLQAYQNSAAARGKLLSGDTAKGLNDYAQNSASGEFQNVYNRSLNDYTTRYNAFNQDQNTQFNRFATLAGLGQTAAGQLANVGLGTAGINADTLLRSGQMIGQDYQNAGAARGSGYVGQANAITGGINGVSNLAMMLAMMKNGGASAGSNGV